MIEPEARTFLPVKRSALFIIELRSSTICPLAPAVNQEVCVLTNTIDQCFKVIARNRVRIEIGTHGVSNVASELYAVPTRPASSAISPSEAPFVGPPTFLLETSNLDIQMARRITLDINYNYTVVEGLEADLVLTRPASVSFSVEGILSVNDVTAPIDVDLTVEGYCYDNVDLIAEHYQAKVYAIPDWSWQDPDGTSRIEAKGYLL